MKRELQPQSCGVFPTLEHIIRMLSNDCGLQLYDCLCNVIIRKCRNIYLSLSNINTEVCAFEPA